MSSIEIRTENANGVIPTPQGLRQVTKDWTEQNYLDYIFTLSLGQCFQFDEQSIRYETVQQRLVEYLPNTITKFTAVYCEPGTDMYSMYGANTVVVAEKDVPS